MFYYLYAIYLLSPIFGLSPFALFFYLDEFVISSGILYPPIISMPVNQYDKVKSMKYIDVPF